MEIKPIETEYKGYRFRSRLEARVAVLFDALRIKWLYEPEGFILSDGTRYLPDFYLPETETFVEVKGVMTQSDRHKVEQFVKDSGKAVVIIYDDFTFEACDLWDGYYELASKSESVLAECDCCGKLYFMGWNGVYGCRACGAYDGCHHFTCVVDGDGDLCTHLGYRSELWTTARNKAKQARFEHGEKPCTGR